MKRILVVDDDPGITTVVKSLLEHNDFEVLLASDGKEAIPIAQTCKPDLIIIDIMMPNLDGGSAVRLLKIDHRTSMIPVLFLTGVTSRVPQGNEAQGINVDGINYPTIAKPFDTADLLSEVHRLLK